MKIAIASDHAGFDQKPAMIEYLQGDGIMHWLDMMTAPKRFPAFRSRSFSG